MGAFRLNLADFFLAPSRLRSSNRRIPSAPFQARDWYRRARCDGPLEVKPATAEDEAILAGLSATRNTSTSAPPSITAAAFVTTYRDALFAGGWKLLDVTKVDLCP